VNETSEDRPGWGGWDYVPEEREGSLDDPVECGLIDTDFGVRGRGDEWRIIETTEDGDVIVKEQVWSTALEAMIEAERQHAGT
jgi:hypothetical protein